MALTQRRVDQPLDDDGEQAAAHAAQQHHGRVIVEVDEAGHEQLMLHIFVLLILPHRFFLTDVVDGIAVHAEEAVQRRVHAVFPAQQKIAVFKKNAHNSLRFD